MRQDAGYLSILRTHAVRTPATAAYRVTFTPEGNRDVYLHCEDDLRTFLKEANIPPGHIEEAQRAGACNRGRSADPPTNHETRFLE